MRRYRVSIKINFAQFENPIDALTLSEWDVSAEDAALDQEEMSSEYRHDWTRVDLQFSPDQTLVLDASLLIANVLADGSLRSMLVWSDESDVDQICELAEPIIEAWNLYCVDEVNEKPNADGTAKRLDAIAGLTYWRDNPEDSWPAYFAQTESNLPPGLGLLRLVVSPAVEDDDLFVLSIQLFWRDV